MEEYGVTDKGFVLKRMDTILEEVHSDLTEGFGIDTRLTRPSFLNVLVTAFCGKIAELWEVAQDSYYAKYPATANGISLDNAVQFGGIRRISSRQTTYYLHCTGDDGTTVREQATVATDTTPEIRLLAKEDFQITKSRCNSLGIKVAALQQDAVYSIIINGKQYSYTSNPEDAEVDILNALKDAIASDEYSAVVDEAEKVLAVTDNTASRSNEVELSENLTTESVTTIAAFLTEDYGSISIPNGMVTKMVNNISGFTGVTNILEPALGRDRETDIELRQSYIAKSAQRSSTMVEGIVGDLLNNVDGVTAAIGYENDEDEVNADGMKPHSIEIIVEGGDENAIASTILNKKAGGIGTNGDIEVVVDGLYGDKIPIRFSRPKNLYVWIKAAISGVASRIPSDYAQLTTDSIMADAGDLHPGTSLITQTLFGGIYEKVSGVTDVKILTAYTDSPSVVPEESAYTESNVIVTQRQKAIVSADRIEVSMSDA